MEPWKEARREKQRAELARRAPMERRAQWTAALALDNRQRERRTAERRALDSATVLNWKARYDAARLQREEGTL